jgi:DNA-binding response OmpR family regulator
MARVLIVEDDAAIGEVLQRSLQLEGYEVALAPDGVAALERAYDFDPDAVILDLGLPRLDGIDVARRIRKDSDIPILILTARDELESRVEGLDAGADDYLVKPFERQELLARVRAMLRRTPPRDAEWLSVADMRLSPAQRQAFRGDREVELTQREFDLVEYLMRNERLVISRDRLLEDVWGYVSPGETNTVDVFVSNLRRKLESGGEPRLLHTVRGAGYVLRAP